jgi:hypothetical protein
MLRLYQLLFSVRYWRSVSLRSVWREAGLSIRRSHKDPRARKFLLALLFLLLLPLLCIAYFVLLVRTGAIFILPFVIPVIWWIRRGHKRDKMLEIAPRPAPRSAPVDDDNPAVRVYLGQMGVLYAAMLDRAGSENFLRNQELPDNVEVISRRTHIDLLRRSEVWDKMAIADREAMMIADGQWTPELIARTSVGLEPLRLLRWVLRIDYFLPTIGSAPDLSYAVAHEIVVNPKKALDAKKIIDVESLATAHKAAEEYFYRCAAESISRGYHEGDHELVKMWAHDVSGSLAGKQGEDLLLGPKLVSEANPAELSRALALARSRMTFLAWIEALLTGSDLPKLPFSFPVEPQSVFPAPGSVDPLATEL